MKKLTSSACVLTLVFGLFWSLPEAEKVHTSEEGLQLIADFEGCRKNAYQCSAKVWTNGIGHTKGVKPGDVVTEKEIARFLLDDVLVAERCVFTKLNGAAMPQTVFDASVSLVVNLGCSGATYNRKYNRPTYLALYAVKADWPAMCNEFPGFKYAAGKVVPGLERRRAAG